MKLYATIYYLYRTALFRILRVFFFGILVFWLLAALGNNESTRIPHFLLHLFVMFEIFYHYKITRRKPVISVQENTGEITRSCTLPVLYANLRFVSTESVIQNLLRTSQGIFLLTRMQALPSEIAMMPIDKTILLKAAAETVKTIGGTYVTSMDVLVTYLLLTEEKTKLFFTKELKEQDILDILRWARLIFRDEEYPKETKVVMSGAGFGQALVTGWTPETKNFTADITYAAVKIMPQITGREKEYKALLEALGKPENNNVLIVGEEGSGRENLVMEMAKQSFLGELGGRLNFKQCLELMIGQLLSGASDRSELETRLQAIVAEVSHAVNVVMYIPEFQDLMGAGSYGLNLSGALLPYLKSGNLPIIATMTTGNYKTYFEENAVREVFNVIRLPEPDAGTAIRMIFAKTADIEQAYPVLISYAAVRTAVEYAGRYVQDDVLPGSAIKLLSDAANALIHADEKSFGKTGRRLLRAEHVTKVVEEKTHVVISAPKGEEKTLLLHLEEKLHEQVIGQNEAVVAVAESLRRLRTAVETRNKPASFLFLGPTGVGKTQMAKTLASVYFQGQGAMIRLDMSEYSDELGERRLLGAPPGQGEERGELTDKVHDNPFSLVLLDEFEKASPKILDLFLQVLDDGRLTDNKGRTVSFANTIIIATSNAGSEYIRESVEKNIPIDATFQPKLFEVLQTQHLFKPELLNRFDAVITFKPLTKEEVMQVVGLLLTEVTAVMLEQDITVQFDTSMIAAIATAGYDKQFGARPLKRFIQNAVDDVIARLKLEDKLKRGNTIHFAVDSSGKIAATVS